MRPAAYIRSSTSTVSGKKSKCSFGCLPAVVADSSIVSSSRYATTEPAACCASRPVSNRSSRRPKSPLSMVATDSKTPSSTSTAVICDIENPVVCLVNGARGAGVSPRATGRHVRGSRYDFGLRSKRPDPAPHLIGRLKVPAATTEDRQSDLSTTPVRAHRPGARLSGKTGRGTGTHGRAAPDAPCGKDDPRPEVRTGIGKVLRPRILSDGGRGARSARGSG